MSAAIKFWLDFGPVLVFFGAYYAADIFWATGAFMAVMPFVIAMYIWKEKRVPISVIITAVVVLVFGGLTIGLKDERFIKIKPTLVYSVFAITLFGGLARGRALLRHVLEAALPPLDAEGWRQLTVRWAWFFAIMAVVNEIVWRNYSESFWVSFKLFGFLPLTFVFAAAQAPLIGRHEIEETR